MNMEQSDVIIDDEPFLDREQIERRPRSRTWPILPPPIETIHEHECDAEIAEPPPIIEEVEPEELVNETQKPETNPRKNSRKNAWGNLSYADLITQAIQSSPEQRLTLSQIYEWMVRNIPYFKDKGDSTSSAGWKNSIRHNLSLHSRFMRVQNDNNGKSSYWVINPDAKPGKSSRRRSGSVDGQPKSDKKRVRNKKHHQSTDDISALSPSTIKFKNRSHENLLFVASPCSSTDSLSNLDEFHSELVYSPYGSDSFARPRSTSNVSAHSSVNGRITPTQPDMEADLLNLDEMHTQFSSGADETATMVESMSIESQCGMANTINLNDSLQMMKSTDHKYGNGNEALLPPRRPHSDSFGSGDSGYESPAYFSPPPQSQQATGLQNRAVQKLPSPSVVPNKPPPPYNQAYPPQLRQQQNSFSNRQEMFYQQQNRLNMLNNQIGMPRLKHLPRPQNTFPSQPNQTCNPHMNSRNFLVGHMQQGNVYDSCLSISNVVAPNITVDEKMVEFQFQRKPQSLFEDMQTDIPMDLHQVKLFEFDDQQQLASDLDAIIKNDMRGSATSLHTICEPFNNDTNNNANDSAMNNSLTSYPAQNWVR